MPLEINSSAQIGEVKKLLEWLGSPPRSPKQIHGINEADCELVYLNDGSYLATTIDSVSEEIALGLYQDPYTMGWVTAQASLSDLAAVGSIPLGVLFSTQWGSKVTVEFKKSVAEGFHDALKEAESFLLGGDSGVTSSTVLTGVGLGICKSRPMTRLGIKPGDYFCITGKTGRGPALSFRFLREELKEQFPESSYRPRARLKQGQILANISSAIIDSSDGLLSSLNHLRSLNQINIELQWNPLTLDPLAVEYCEQRNIPLWSLWIGEHGDFELIAAIPSENLSLAKSLCPDLQEIGRAIEGNGEITVNFIKHAKENRKKVDINLTQFLSSGNNVNTKNLSIKLEELIQYLKKEGFP